MGLLGLPGIPGLRGVSRVQEEEDFESIFAVEGLSFEGGASQAATPTNAKASPQWMKVFRVIGKTLYRR